MLDEKTMRDALPHIQDAHRCLEMLRLFVENKEKLSLHKRVPTYYNKLIENVIAIQAILLEDNEFTERVGRSLAEVSKTHEYSWNVTQNNKGDTFYAVDAMLSADALKKNVLVLGRTGLSDLKGRQFID